MSNIAPNVKELVKDFYRAVTNGIDADDALYSAYYQALTKEEDLTLIAAMMTETGPGLWDGKPYTDWDFISLAEIHAVALTRAGKEDFLKSQVPFAAQNEAVSAALKEKAPVLSALILKLV